MLDGLDAAQKVSLIGVIITAVTSITTLIFTVKINRNTAYVNSVTKERIGSMNALKLNISEFISILYSALSNESRTSLKELYKLKTLIEFQLNDNRNFESSIICRLNNIVWLYNLYINIDEIKNYLELKVLLEEKNISYSNELIYLNNHRLLKSILTIELNLLELALKKHVKGEWDKVKNEL
ncbi:hypothetical protein [Metabacillus fastidiosus]|uniref:hypothetical protein n=1 Tax=Metabacillus fastidiosus TaxID=1458 RepID=UPI002DB94936|nr:hypothetical protein [Metabacillus fastidiosus]MEC2076307.1 hypothetical protein [Metabacillus fastidiosus]